MNSLEFIKYFVEGKVDFDNLIDQINNDSCLQEVLEEEVGIRPYTNSGNLLLYIVAQNPQEISSQIAVRDALSKFLTIKGLPHSIDSELGMIHELVLSQAPNWANLQDDFIQNLRISIQSMKSKKEMVSHIRSEIKKSFRYLNKPPKWVQSPEWIFNKGKPLLFVGQIAMNDIFHDEAQIFVFFDQTTSTPHTIIQKA